MPIIKTNPLLHRFAADGRLRRLAHTVKARIGENDLTIETGRLARLADGAAVATLGQTSVCACIR